MLFNTLSKTLSLGSLCAFMIIAGCASSPDVYTQVAPGSDFRAIQSYGFMPELSTDKGDYQSLETNFLKVAVAQQLDAKGLRYDPRNPDVLMNFFILTDEKIQTRQTSTVGVGYSGYYGYRGGRYGGFGVPMGGMGYETTVQQYTEGTLTIDMIDPNERKLLWEGTIKGRVTKDAVKNMESTIDKAVAEVFAKFPVLDSELTQ